VSLMMITWHSERSSSKNALAGESVFFAGQESLPKGLYVMKVKFDGKVVQRVFFRN
jgi:hypothetical protein